MADKKQDETSILGDINPVKHAVNERGEAFRDTANVTANDQEVDPLEGAARKEDSQRRAGSRDTEESFGSATTGGTRNMHSTGGATGSDIGNRPE